MTLDELKNTTIPITRRSADGQENVVYVTLAEALRAVGLAISGAVEMPLVDGDPKSDVVLVQRDAARPKNGYYGGSWAREDIVGFDDGEEDVEADHTIVVALPGDPK